MQETDQPLELVIDINSACVADCTDIVALASAEQLQKVLKKNTDILIAGRATDIAIIATLPLLRGFNSAAVWHGAMVVECGALATTKPGWGMIMISVEANGFTIVPTAEKARATPYTISAHMLYENSYPFHLYETCDHLHVTGATYFALDEQRARVNGSK